MKINNSEGFMRLRLVFLSSCSVVLMIACSTTNGPGPVVNRDGAIPQTASTGLTSVFLSDSASALKDYVGGSDADSQAASSRKMLVSGLALIAANCNDFFSSAAQNQKWIIFSRDTVGAVGTLATSILSLTNASKTAVAAVAIGTGAGFTGLDLYTKDFLFAAENVSSVRDLTYSALLAHKIAALNTPAASYPEVVLALQYEQDLCTPMRIASLVRQAIAAGQGVATVSSPASTSPQDATQDAQILSELGRLLNPPSALDTKHAAALWWLFLGSPSQYEATNYIYPLLDDLSATNGNSASWIASLSSSAISAIKADLSGFSLSTQANIKQSIVDQQQAESTQAKARQNAANANENAVAARAAAASAVAASAPDAASAVAVAAAATASAASAVAAVPKQPTKVLLGAPAAGAESALSRITVTIH